MFDCDRYGDDKDSPIPERIVNEEQNIVTLVFPDGSTIQESDAVKSYFAPDGSSLLPQRQVQMRNQQQQQRQLSQQALQQEFLEGESADRKRRLLDQQQRQDTIRDNSDKQEAERP